MPSPKSRLDREAGWKVSSIDQERATAAWYSCRRQGDGAREGGGESQHGNAEQWNSCSRQPGWDSCSMQGDWGTVEG